MPPSGPMNAVKVKNQIKEDILALSALEDDAEGNLTIVLYMLSQAVIVLQDYIDGFSQQLKH